MNPISPSADPLNSSPPVPTITSESIDSIQERLDELEALAKKLNTDDRYEVENCGLQLPEDFLLSIVVPVYNEEATIRSMVARLVSLTMPVEIIVVDDGSSDRTTEVMQELAELPNSTLIAKPKNEGKGAAVRS